MVEYPKSAEKGSEDRTDRAYVAIDPAVVFGRPCIASRRVETEKVADRIYYGFPLSEVAGLWELTEREVMVACWYEACYGRRRFKNWWSEWGKDAVEKLWHVDGPLPEPPPAKEAR